MEAHLKPEYSEARLSGGIDPESRRSLLKECVSLDLMRRAVDSSIGAALPKVGLFDSNITAPESQSPPPGIREQKTELSGSDTAQQESKPDLGQRSNAYRQTATIFPFCDSQDPTYDPMRCKHAADRDRYRDPYRDPSVDYDPLRDRSRYPNNSYPNQHRDAYQDPRHRPRPLPAVRDADSPCPYRSSLDDDKSYFNRFLLKRWWYLGRS